MVGMDMEFHLQSLYQYNSCQLFDLTTVQFVTDFDSVTANVLQIFKVEGLKVGMWRNQPKSTSVGCRFHVQNPSEAAADCAIKISTSYYS